MMSKEAEEFVRYNEKMNSSLITDWNREMLIDALQIYADKVINDKLYIVLLSFGIEEPKASAIIDDMLQQLKTK